METWYDRGNYSVESASSLLTPLWISPTIRALVLYCYRTIGTTARVPPKHMYLWIHTSRAAHWAMVYNIYHGYTSTSPIPFIRVTADRPLLTRHLIWVDKGVQVFNLGEQRKVFRYDSQPRPLRKVL